MRKLLRNRWVLNGLVLAAVVILLLPFFLDLLNYMGLTGVKTEYAGDRVVIQDDAQLLTDEEEAELAKYMGPVAELCPAAFLTTESTGGLSNSLFAQKAYDRFFPREEGVLFATEAEASTISAPPSGTKTRLITSMHPRQAAVLEAVAMQAAWPQP